MTMVILRMFVHLARALSSEGFDSWRMSSGGYYSWSLPAISLLRLAVSLVFPNAEFVTEVFTVSMGIWSIFAIIPDSCIVA